MARERGYRSLSEKVHFMMMERERQDRKFLNLNAKELHKKNDPKGTYVLAKTHYGKGDIERALSLFDEAAKQGHAGACYELARLYLLGNTFRGIKKDYELVERYVSLPDKKNKRGSTEFDMPNYNQSHYMKQLDSLRNVLEATKSMETGQSRYYTSR